MKFAVVAIGGSAGALSGLKRIAEDLPADVPAAVFVATHVPADGISAMPHILSRCGALFATHAIDGAPITPGRIFIAPPNFHLILERNVMRVVDTARENGHRPSIDVLLRSAAIAFGDLACGVLLSGTLDDGVAGMNSIRKAGGMTIAQDPADALFPDMPRNAIAADAVQRTATTDELGMVILESVADIVGKAGGVPISQAAPDERSIGAPSRFTCPDCGGTLWEADENGDLRFRCRTGHAYNPNAMLSAQRDSMENSLWTALRILEERVDFFHRMSRRARDRGDPRTADRYANEAQHLQADQGHIRSALESVVSRPHTSAS